MTEKANIASRLREETRDLHDAAENHEFQRAFGGGRLPRDVYVRYLEQMLHVYKSLEAAIRSTIKESKVLSAMIHEHNFREQDLRADLEFFESPADAVEPVAATTMFCERISQVARKNPDTLIGYHYVVEGSNNGSKFIARNIRRAYGLVNEAGTRYLDPYGDRQREVWTAYKSALTELELDSQLADDVVAAARHMFQTVADISSELLEPAEQR